MRNFVKINMKPDLLKNYKNRVIKNGIITTQRAFIDVNKFQQGLKKLLKKYL